MEHTKDWWQTMVTRVLASRDEGTARKMYRRTALYFVSRFDIILSWREN